MTTRTSAPIGAPCWTDLWTSDVEGARKFYSELLGWEALEPNEEFGGYFMFQSNGVPVGGGMGAMDDMKPDNKWKVYFNTDDIHRTAKEVSTRGGQVFGEVGVVADLGSQAVFADPTGAAFGAWQPGTFPGFTVLGEQGAPSWFELMTTDYAPTLDFYKGTLGWTTSTMSDTAEFRYTIIESKEGEQLGGVMDAAGMMPEGETSAWSVYWGVADVDASIADVARLGGTVRDGPMETEYGRMAFAVDPFGARFNLHQPNP
jgi:uncharacterized protein